MVQRNIPVGVLRDTAYIRDAVALLAVAGFVLAIAVWGEAISSPPAPDDDVAQVLEAGI